MRNTENFIDARSHLRSHGSRREAATWAYFEFATDEVRAVACSDAGGIQGRSGSSGVRWGNKAGTPWELLLSVCWPSWPYPVPDRRMEMSYQDRAMQFRAPPGRQDQRSEYPILRFLIARRNVAVELQDYR